MSDLQLLFLVLTILYGWECAVWLGRGSVAFTTWLGRSWRPAHPGTLLGNQRGGFIFAAPLPPLGCFVTATQFPLSLSPQTALAFVAVNVNPGWRAAQSGRWRALDTIREARAAGRKLVVNGEIWLIASSPSSARRLADALTRLANLKPAQRGQAIRELLEATLDTESVEKCWQKFRRESRRLRWLCNVVTAYLFVLAPVVICNLGLKLSWPGLLIGLFALTAVTAALFWRAHHVLYHEAEDERFTQTLTIALSPVNAMRAHDALSRPLLEQFHPLATAKVFLPAQAFRNLARGMLLDLRTPALPLCPSNENAPCEAEVFSRQALRAAAEDLVKRSGVSPDALCRAPEPADEACRAYCPRCHAQFTSLNGQCADCGGLELVEFPPHP